MLVSDSYPVSVEADYPERLNRFLWIIKWLLILPHLILLPFFWLASFFITIAASFAIVFTGQYPRSLFQFNAGLLAWHWRVDFFFMGQNGTNRYPQFGIGRKDYPAQLSIEYPDGSSRLLALLGLPFLRAILLIPHWIIVLFFGVAEGWGVRGVLVFFSLVALLLTGRYPESLFLIILGMNRWMLRVMAYSMMLTDKYPPFRFGD